MSIIAFPSDEQSMISIIQQYFFIEISSHFNPLHCRFITICEHEISVIAAYDVSNIFITLTYSALEHFMCDI